MSHHLKKPLPSANGIHNTAVVAPSATIGSGTRIWHFTHVMEGAVIGEGCTLGQNVFVAAGVVIGNGVKIQNNVSIYEGITIDDDVFIGPSVVFTNVTIPRAHISRRNRFEKTHVRQGATLGANATVVCGHDIGPFAFIGAGAVVTRAVAAHAVVVGNPARTVGWACRCGARLDDVNLDCVACGDRYQALEDGLRLIPAGK